jgi:alpha-L-rhamnosidase
VVNDTRRGAVQTAYQIIVATDWSFAEDKLVWDTGKVQSNQSIHVAYGGPALKSSTRYFWKVQTWDATDQPSQFSMPSWFETALLDRRHFRAKWIGAADAPASEKPPKLGPWIWNQKDTTKDLINFFRLPIELPQGSAVQNANLYVAVDDQYTAFVNGQELGTNAGWNNARKHDLAPHLKPGKNVIAIKATNHGGPGGVIAAIRIKLADGKTIERQSGTDWLVHTEEQENWTAVAFNDGGWAKAVAVVEYGDPPWGAVSQRTPPRDSVCMRKEFKLDKEIKRARAYVTGLGIYQMHLNGHVVGKDIFTPGWTNYHKRIQYQTYDVTDQLHKGANAVGMMLGNGWWSSHFHWHDSDPYASGQLRSWVQIDVEFKDGTKTRIITDPTWKSNATPVIRNTYYHGETYDARKEMDGWDKPAFNDSKWGPTEALDIPVDILVAQQCEPIRVTQELEPMTISMPVEGVFIADFGQNASGRVRIKVKGSKAGDKITLRFGEELDPDGNLYRRNYRSAQATDEYICKGAEEEIWEPLFTYRGFRYCEITGWPQKDPKKPVAPPKDALTMRVLHSAAPRAGEFECSHWLINRIYENIMWGQRSNLHSVPTDCPQRDERLGWMGDAQTFAPSACWNMQMIPFFSKWLRDIDDSRSPEGAVTDVAPAAVVRGAAKPGWGDAVVIVPWVLYQFTGDKRILDVNYEQMAGWVDYMTAHGGNDLYEVEGYGDWVPAMGVKSPKKPIGSAYYYYSTKIVAQTAELLGLKEDARKYEAQAARTRKAFNAKHFDATTANYPGGTQTANILPVWFGITNDDQREAVTSNIVADIKSRDYHLTTGFLGTAYLMPLLTQFGYDDVAWRLATQTTQPSWGYMAVQGATTVWERWDTDKQGPNMNSRNHFCFGVVAQWFYETIAGINIDPENPGFKNVIIRPRPMGKLVWAQAKYPSLYGDIDCRWRRPDDDSLDLEVKIPANTTARVHLPVKGKDAWIMESGQGLPTQLVRHGEAVGGGKGIKLQEIADEEVVFNVSAGRYRFFATPLTPMQ